MTYPRTPPGDEASVPKEFIIEDDLRRDEATTAEDTANVSASQTLQEQKPKTSSVVLRVTLEVMLLVSSTNHLVHCMIIPQGPRRS